jgi:outer membrane receptor for ferrienterochelin and colicins
MVNGAAAQHRSEAGGDEMPAADSMATNFLEQVVVTATRSVRTLKDAPVHTKVLSNTAISETGATTVLDVLEYLVPGLSFQPNNHGDNIRMQGLDNKYILVLLNGERLVNGRVENVNFGRFNLNDIQRIEMIDGAASVLYGSSAIGSVINLITRETTRPLDIHAGGRYASYNTYAGDVAAGWRRGGWAARTLVDVKGSDGYRLAGRRVEPYDQYMVSQRVQYQRNRQLNAEVYGSFYGHNLFPYQDPTHRRELDYNAGARVQCTAGAHTLVAAGHTDRYNLYTVFDRLSGSRLDNNYYLTTVRATDLWALGDRARLLVGYEWNHEYSYSYNLYGADTTTHTSFNHNLFAQVEGKIAGAWDVVAGSRLTGHSEFGIHFAPKLSVMYTAGAFRFRAGVSHGFREPSLKELFYSFDMPGGYYIQGNRSLRPETSWYESVSAEYIAPRFNASVTVYNNDIRENIATVEYIATTTLATPVLRYENVADAAIRGIDVSAQGEVAGWLSLRAHYVLAATENRATGEPVSGASRHNFTGGATFRYTGWRIGGCRAPLRVHLAGRLLSPRLYNSVAPGVVVGTRSKPLSLWRLIYSQSILHWGALADVELQIGVDNLFNWTDQAYSVNPGRTFFAALRIRFGKD